MLARAFGAKGFAAESLKELEHIVSNEFDGKGPCLIDCKINQDERVLPFIPPEVL
jgi:acetolactate synthase-1/2/3 large subunit